MILVNCEKEKNTIKNFWNNIHFHPTDAIEDPWGREILDKASEDGVAKTVRMYAMLEDIVTMDENGTLHYNFRENDTRLDYIVSKGFDVFLSYNFLPPCITENSESFQHASKKGTRYKGKMICTSRLKDDSLWEEICYRYTKHIVERYGIDTVKRWYLQCYNEPDLPLFFMTELGELPNNLEGRVEEYLRLYRGFTRGVERINQALKCGGPATAGRMTFCEKFLEATKREGLKFDFFSGHAYGTDPMRLNDGSQPFDTKSITDIIKQYQDLLNLYYPDTEIIIDEWGASSCGFYDRDECPKLLFREGSEFAAYYGKLIANAIDAKLRISRQMICLSGQHDLPCDFSGCRNFMGKNLIKKPIYNAYVLLNKLGTRLVESKTDIDGLTVLSTVDDSKKYAIMLAYASEHFDTPLPDVTEMITLTGIDGEMHVKIRCIDNEHTNPYKFAQKMNWGDQFDKDQIAKLKQIGEMKPIFEYDQSFNGTASIPISFTSNALALIEISSIK